MNGNKLIAFVLLACLVAACSPKTQGPVVEKPVDTRPVDPPAKPVARQPAKISLVLPFQLNEIPAKPQAKDIEKAALALDFYQGFRLALDSLAGQGHLFHLDVFDSQDNDVQTVNLARAVSVMGNDLVIGPIYPESIRTFTEFAAPGKLLVNPLAAASPQQFNNPNLVTLNNSIEQHAQKLGNHIIRNFLAAQTRVILMNTKKVDDERMAAPVRSLITADKAFVFSEQATLSGIDRQLDRMKTNVVILTSADPQYVRPVVDRLFALSQQGFTIRLFAHPAVSKMNNVETEKLQALATIIPTSYFVNRKAPRVQQFVAAYRGKYGIEPTEYAFRGFDCGYFFGQLLARHGSEFRQHLTEQNYLGLHNRIQLIFDPMAGFINQGLYLLQYRGFELIPVE